MLHVCFNIDFHKHILYDKPVVKIILSLCTFIVEIFTSTNILETVLKVLAVYVRLGYKNINEILNKF